MSMVDGTQTFGDFSTEVHGLRKRIDAVIVETEGYIGSQSVTTEYRQKYIREMSLVRTKLQEAKMWAGKVLEQIGSELPEQYRDKA